LLLLVVLRTATVLLAAPPEDQPPAEAAKQVWAKKPLDLGSQVYHAAFTPDGKFLIYLDIASVRYWDLKVGKERQDLAVKMPIGGGTGFGPSRIAFSTDRKQLAVLETPFNVASKQRVKIIGVTTAAAILLAKQYANISTIASVNLTPSMAWAPDGRLLVTASETERGVGELIVFDAATGKPRFTLPGFRENVHAVAFSADGKRIAYAGTRAIKVFDLARREETVALPAAKDGSVETLCFTPDNDHLITVHDGAMAAGLGQWMQAAAPGGARTAPPPSAIRVWDLTTRKPLTLFQAAKLDDSCRFGALSPDGKTFAGGITKGTVFGELGAAKPPEPSSAIVLWDVATGKELTRLEVRKGVHLTGIAFAPDGRRLMATAFDASKKTDESTEIHLWERTDAAKSSRDDSSERGTR
jgi:WD40 repeat protein